MPKWKKGETEFTVGVSDSAEKGIQTRLPKPVFETLGKPERVTFVVKGKRVELRAGENEG